MKISAIKEKAQNEKRVAITPEAVKTYVKMGFEVCLEKGIGESSNFFDAEYAEAGAKLSSVPMEILSDADIILKVQFSPSEESYSEKVFAKEGAIIIGLLNPYENQELVQYYKEKKINLLAMEFVPRTTKAQSFDALSSQSNLVGYRAVIEAANLYPKSIPMFMTAAGTIVPAKLLVLGAGVAGLQAIATAKRLGASVYAYDVRAAAKEQVESLGAKFLYPEEKLDLSNNGIYAKETGTEFASKQEEMLEKEISKFDIVITTAMIPGKKAPILITKNMVHKMKPGSVIVDAAASGGGNCEYTKLNEISEENGVKILGWSNFASNIAQDASKLYAKNLSNLITYLSKNSVFLDESDEIVKSMLLTCRENA